MYVLIEKLTKLLGLSKIKIIYCIKIGQKIDKFGQIGIVEKKLWEKIEKNSGREKGRKLAKGGKTI